MAKIAVNMACCPGGVVKVGFWEISKALAGRDGLKRDSEWSRTLPRALQTPWAANSPDSLHVAQNPILTSERHLQVSNRTTNDVFGLW